MVKTLRITTIVAVLLAAVFLVFLVVFGSRGDRAIEEFLKSPGAIEKFQRARGDEARDEGQISPLVKQAQAFALYLNPPPPKQPAVRPSKPRREPRPKVTSPKFKLVGTSFYELHPDLSLALIDEPGKGIRWVRQSDQVGHLLIEQIKDGLVVVKDGSRTFEVAVVDRPKKVNLIKSATLYITEDAEPIDPEEVARLRAEEIARARAEEAAALEGLVHGLKAIEAEEDSEQAGIDEEDEQADEMLAKFIESIRISAEEAKELNRLGKKLQNGGTDPNAEPNLANRTPKVERRPQRPRK